jgi:hypothetical protein
MSNKTTNALQSAMSCFPVIFTDSTSENLNMVVPHAKATAEAPATAIKRTLVGGYEVFARFASGNGLPLLTTNPRGSKPRGDFLRMHWPVSSRVRSGDEYAQDFQFKTPNAKNDATPKAVAVD